jgi:flavin-dependent dehydrogenase
MCVIGAGPAATASAIAACDAGATVALVGSPPVTRPGKLELLSADACDSLIELGLRDLVQNSSQPCAGTVSRWFADEFIERSCLLEPRGGGWITDRAVLDPLLLAQAVAHGVHVLPERAIAVDPDDGTGVVHVGTRRESLRAAAAIVATGRGAGVVRRITNRTIRHRVVALCLTMDADAIPGLGQRLLVDRAPRGWWYALADTRSTSVVYCVDADTIRTTGGTAATWHDGCRAVADWLPCAAAARAPYLRPAVLGSTRPVAHRSVHLVGDAAIAVDPLSGHGLTLAFESAMRWADAEYGDWVSETDQFHQQRERETYRAAVGPVDGPFWSRRQN